MRKILLTLLAVYAGYVTYLVRKDSDYIAHQQQDNSALTQQLQRAQNAVPRNGPLAQQATCATQADAERQKLQSSPRDGSKILVATAVGHYNATLNRCLVRSQLTTQHPNGQVIWIISVKDAFDGKEFATSITERAHLQDDAKTNQTMACTY